jgi:hypothetical protein
MCQFIDFLLGGIEYVNPLYTAANLLFFCRHGVKIKERWSYDTGFLPITSWEIRMVLCLYSYVTPFTTEHLPSRKSAE